MTPKSQGQSVSKLIIFCGILFVHWGAQFAAWNLANQMFPNRVPWQILSVPLMLMAGSTPNASFWLLATLNSVLWAAALTYLIQLLVRGQRATN